jgi:hypothetical protein
VAKEPHFLHDNDDGSTNLASAKGHSYKNYDVFTSAFGAKEKSTKHDGN